jgi:hypothetical protein
MELPPESYESVRSTTSTIRITNVGAPVTIEPPPPDRQVRDAN